MEDFHNLYLLAGIRGDFEACTGVRPVSVEYALLHRLDEWGIRPPWGACTSGVDLESNGGEVLRAWAHVDLRTGAATSPLPDDVPIAGLLRMMWDALELYGRLTFDGVDVSVPIDCVGERFHSRVGGSVVRHPDRTVGQHRSALLEAGRSFLTEWNTPPSIGWDVEAVVETLSEYVDVRRADGDVPHVNYRSSPIEHPFPREPDPESFRAEVTLPAWTIDDAAWLAETMCLACAKIGIKRDVEIAVRRAD